MKWLDAARARLRLLVARRAAESRMNQEFRLHIELETEKLMRDDGLAPDEARRLALVAFGGVEKHKEALRDGRGLAWLGSFSLDLKVAIRMVARYPWLTLVGSAAMAFGIAAAVGAFEIRTQFVDPSLPLDEGSRIVGFRNWDASRNQPCPGHPLRLRDLARRAHVGRGLERGQRVSPQPHHGRWPVRGRGRWRR